MKEEMDSQHRKNSVNSYSKQIAMQSDEPGYKPILKKGTNSEFDSDSTSSEANRSKTLREKLNSEFHHVRQARNYFNNVNYNPELMSNSGNSNEVLGMSRI